MSCWSASAACGLRTSCAAPSGLIRQAEMFNEADVLARSLVWLRPTVAGVCLAALALALIRKRRDN